MRACGKPDQKGINRSGTQRCLCKECGIAYTVGSKQRAYPEETKQLAIKMFYSGVSGRGVGKVLGMNKSNMYNWIKKHPVVDNLDCAELDELYWFIERKPKTETHENVYILTMVSRKPRQIVGFDVSYDKSARAIQSMVDEAPPAQSYFTDDYVGYLDVDLTCEQQPISTSSVQCMRKTHNCNTSC